MYRGDEVLTKPLRHYQQTALAKSEGKPGFGYLMEQRTGKTPTTIKDIERSYKSGEITAAIIVCPRAIISDWVGCKDDESGFAYWCEAPHYAVGWKTGAKPDHVLTSHGGEFLRVFVVNYDAIVRKEGAAWKTVQKMQGMHKCFVAFDESQRIKNPTAARTKRALEMAAAATIVRILSGTPATESPLNLWPQGTAIGVKPWPRSYFAFRNRYCITRQRSFPGRKAFTEIVGYKNTEELERILEPFTFRITRKEAWPETPDKQYSKLYVEMGTKQQRAYDEMKKKLRTELENGEEVTAQLAITKLMRLQQITGGFVGVDSGGVEALPDSQRLPTLVDYLEDVEGKVIIWSRYTAEIDAIVEALRDCGRNPVRFDGKTSNTDRELAKAAFRAGALNDYTDFVGNMAAGDVGLTLDGAGTVIYYSNHDSLDKRLQSEDRPVSITNKVQVVDMVARGTVDEKIIKALREKRDLSATLMGDELLSWI